MFGDLDAVVKKLGELNTSIDRLGLQVKALTVELDAAKKELVECKVEGRKVCNALEDTVTALKQS